PTLEAGGGGRQGEGGRLGRAGLGGDGVGALEPELLAGEGEALAGAGERVEDPGSGLAADAIEGYADGEVAVAVAVEVPRREGEAEPVLRFRVLLEVELAPVVVFVGREPGGGPVEHLGDPHVVAAGDDGLAGCPDGEVVAPVTV